MKKLLFWIIVIIILSIIPVIPHDVKLNSGATLIENKSILEYVIEQYNQRQK